ncbi:hypothetical protein GW17_00032073 [Ensete ventricosum]|nr:hypothetical protein GW17_00032073 [Ensete ventricosum]
MAAPCGWQPPCQGAATIAVNVVAPAGDRAGRGRDCPRSLGRNQSPLQRTWPWSATPFPCYFHCENVARTRRTILRDSISSHVV